MMNYSSVPKLQKLAAKPVDLTAHLTPERIEKMCVEALGFKLFYGTERVSEEAVSLLFELAKEARVMEKMNAMQEGEVINKIEGFPSENRAVLHTAMRDQFGEKVQSKAARDAAEKAGRELEKLERFSKKFDDFTDIIQIGIGGPDLGQRALGLALEPCYLKGQRANFTSKVDPDDAHGVLARVDV